MQLKNGGITINGTAYYIELVLYDDGADCSTMEILYDRLINQDQVDFLFAPVTFNCSQLALMAEAASIPYLNADDYTLSLWTTDPLTYPSYTKLNWTFAVLPQSSTLASTCVSALAGAGAHTYAIVNVASIPYDDLLAAGAASAFGMVPAINETLLDLDQITAKGCSYLNPFLDNIIKAKPDVWFFSASTETETLLDCMHRKKYNPKGGFIFAGGPDPSDSKNGWQTYGYTSEQVWQFGTNFFDPVFGDLFTYLNLYQQIFNQTAESQLLPALTANAATLISTVINQTQSLDHNVIRSALLAFNQTTMFGPTFFATSTVNQLLYRPFLCIQLIDASNTSVVNPQTFPGAVPIVYPWKFNYPKVFLDSLHHGLSTKNRNIIIICTIIGGVVIIAAIVAVIYLIHSKFHLIWVPKQNDMPAWEDR